MCYQRLPTAPTRSIDRAYQVTLPALALQRPLALSSVSSLSAPRTTAGSSYLGLTSSGWTGFTRCTRAPTWERSITTKRNLRVTSPCICEACCVRSVYTSSLILSDADAEDEVAARIAIRLSRPSACTRQVRTCETSGLAGYCKKRATWTKVIAYELRTCMISVKMELRKLIWIASAQ
jgi:hypothetical protein